MAQSLLHQTVRDGIITANQNGNHDMNNVNQTIRDGISKERQTLKMESKENYSNICLRLFEMKFSS